MKNKKKKAIIKIIILIMIIFLTLFSVKTYISINENIKNNYDNNVSIQEENETKKDFDVDNNNSDELKEENNVSQGVAVPGWSAIKIPANTKNINVDLYNPEENAGLYNITFEIRLIDNSEIGYEVLYKSDIINPGQHIKEISLSRALTIGEYDAIVHVQPYRLDGTKTNNADMKTRLIVK